MDSKERAKRNRYKLKKHANGRIRLSVFRSIRHFSVQAIDDEKGVTIAHASSNFKDFPLKTSSVVEKVEWVGQEIAKKLSELSVKTVYLDRGAYSYHGKIKAFAEAARNAGLDF